MKSCRAMMAGWLLASIAWIAFVVWRGASDAPMLPLDVRANDPDVQTALQAAVTRHNLQTGLLALGVPVLAYGFGRVLCRWLGGASPTVTAIDHPDGGPSRILLMRHAEKTGDPEDIYLSEAGTKRAERLSTYIPQTFGRPDFVFAASRSKRSVRSMETVRPLAAALGVKLHHHIEDRDFEDLVSEIFSNPEYRGKTIVICWHHGKLDEIAALLGAPVGSYPNPWPEDVYNLILDFRYDPNSDRPPVVTQVVEPF
jgi:phosphohistidine phosphatase SixA